ncbi:MAG TPA: hypothetical protein VKA21_08720, partial [Candidatus Binatia bacterium]|nr:hypothetical protein [Candidatus Binatia bacterium]
MAARLLVLPPVLALLLLASTVARASHSIFSGSVDRFEVDGNAFGPADGTLDQVDDFDDGTIAPHWEVLLGTAVEAGGVVTLKNPGADVSLVPGASLDISDIENVIDVANGEGDFTATSYWVPSLPSTNTGWHFQLYGIGNAIEAAGLTVNDLDAELAAETGDPVGYSISQEVTFIGGSGTPQHDVVAIDPGQVTGQVVLRMAFDDASDALTCSFSLDGGTTFQSPFPPLHVFQAVDEHEILLGASAMEPTGAPPPGSCVTILHPRLGFRRLAAGASGQQVSLRGVLPLLYAPNVLINPVMDGATLALTPVGSDVPVWSVAIPPGGPGTGCDPRDGWRLGGATYRYSNLSNALPPGCVVGSAQGVTTMKIKDQRWNRGEVGFRARAKRATVAPPPTALDADVI